jgi:hypothetical protein
MQASVNVMSSISASFQESVVISYKARFRLRCYCRRSGFIIVRREYVRSPVANSMSGPDYSVSITKYIYFFLILHTPVRSFRVPQYEYHWLTSTSSISGFFTRSFNLPRKMAQLCSTICPVIYRCFERLFSKDGVLGRNFFLILVNLSPF